MSQDELRAFFFERIESINSEKQSQRNILLEIEPRIEYLKNQLFQQKKDETEEKLAELISNLEFEYITQSRPNFSSREYMRELTKLQQRKKHAAASDVIRLEFDSKRKLRQKVLQDLRTADLELQELRYGLRKLNISVLQQIDLSELVEKKFTIQEESIPKIVGKGGERLRQLESKYFVSIELSRFGGEVSVIGLTHQIDRCFDEIQTIADSTSRDVPCSAPLATFLLYDKASALLELCSKFGVRMDLRRETSSCRILGPSSAVDSAADHLSSLSASNMTLKFPPDLLPVILGKKGSTVSGLASHHRVQIDINRTSSSLTVSGLTDSVQLAIATLTEMIEGNRVVSEKLFASRQALFGAVIGSGGQLVRSLQKELSVSLTMYKGNEEEPHIILQGSQSRVIAARSRVEELVRVYESDALPIPIPPLMTSIFVGKNGSNIKKFREAHPEVNIDVSPTLLKICGGTAQQRDSASEAVLSFLNQNSIRELSASSDLLILLKSPSGSSIRTKMIKDLGLTLDINVEKGIVVVRGSEKDLEVGETNLREFFENNFSILVDLTEEDVIALSNNTSIASSEEVPNLFPIPYVGSRFQVSPVLLQRERKLRIRGPPSRVEQAREYIELMLNGEEGGGSTVFPLPSYSFSTLIGRSGITLSQFQDRFKVRIDILKSGKVRIRGSTSSLPLARDSILRYLDETPFTSTLKLGEDVPSTSVDQWSSQCSQQYSLSVSRKDSSVVFRGTLYQIHHAKAYFQSLVSSQFQVSCPLPPVQNLTREPELIQYIARLRSEFTDIEISPDLPQSTISISGEKETCLQVQQLLQDWLKFKYPANFISLTSSHQAISAILSFSVGFEIFHLSQGRVQIFPNPPLSSVVVLGDPQFLPEIISYLERQLFAPGRRATLSIAEFMFPVLVGKKGENIRSLEKACGASLRVDRASFQIEIETTKPELLESAVSIVQRRIDQLQAERFEFEVSSELVGPLLGKKGSTLIQFRDQTTALIEFDFLSRILKITGTEIEVARSKDRILSHLNEFKKKLFTKAIRLRSEMVPFIIGPRGETVRDVELISDTRIDVNRATSVLTIRGSPESCESAVRLINERLESEGLDPIRATLDPPSLPENPPSVPTSSPQNTAPKIPPGASPEMILRWQSAQTQSLLSKSALKRKKKKDKLENSSEGSPEEPHLGPQIPLRSEDLLQNLLGALAPHLPPH